MTSGSGAGVAELGALVVAERLVPLADGLAEPGRRGPLLECVSLPGVPGDAVEDGAYRYLATAREIEAIVLAGLGGAAWPANFDLFEAWGLGVRDHAIAVTLTGLAIAGAGYFFTEVLGFFTGLHRKFTGEAETIEKAGKLRRVA